MHIAALSHPLISVTTSRGEARRERGVCDTCGDTRDLGQGRTWYQDGEGGAWHCQRCWDAWERDDPLASAWSTVTSAVCVCACTSALSDTTSRSSSSRRLLQLW